MTLEERKELIQDVIDRILEFDSYTQELIELNNKYKSSVVVEERDGMRIRVKRKNQKK